MSGWFGGKTISTETPRIGAMRINASAYGLCEPLLWGTNRIAGNLIWYGDFKAIAHTTTQGGKGGDTTFSSTTYTYTCAFALGLCAGEIENIGRVWKDKEKTTTADLKLTIFKGTLPQSPWNYLVSKHADQALGYPGLAYVAAGAFDLGDSAYLPNLNFEVRGRRVVGELTVGNTILDARPDEIASDLLTDTLFGAGFPVDKLAGLAGYRDYCQASGFFVSPAITEQAPAAEHLRALCQMTNSEVVWSEGLLKFVPYGDSPVTGNGVTWTPDTTPLFDLTDNDFLHDGDEDVIVVNRKTPADAFNRVQIEFSNRDSDYNPDLGEAKDPANIAQYGLRPRDPIQMRWITRRSMADQVADLVMRRDLYIRNEYSFRLGWRFAMLEPMDIVTLTHAPAGLLLAPVRIVSIEESSDGDLAVVAEEMPWAISTPARITTQETSGSSPDFNVAPGNANTPTLFEPPISLSLRPELWLATSGGPNWGGAEVWVSLDDATYSMVGTVSAPARHGTLSAPLPAGGDPDVSSTLSVDLGVSQGVLTSGTVLDRDRLTTLCWVDGELVAYQTATLTGASRYDLASLRRGAWGTPIGEHAANSRFVRLDQAVFKYPYDKDLVGQTLYVKLRSFNIYGGAVQDLATLTPTTYAIAGAPVGGIGGLFPEQPFTGRSAKIAWQAMPAATGYRVEVWAGSALQRTTDTADTRFEYGFEDAIADGGPWRTLEFHVYALTETGISATPALLQLTNPQIDAPTAVRSLALMEGFSISCAKPADTDYAGCRVWASLTSGFDPDTTAPVYDGPDTSYAYYGLTAGETWYVRIGCYDVFGTDGMTLSSEAQIVIRGIAADPATTLAEINGLLSDGSGTARVEMIADRFSIVAPDGIKTPFAVVDTGGGAYKTLLNSDVLIGGDVDIANLKTGSLAEDVIMRLGGGTIELDGAGELRVYAALGSNQNFVRLTAAQIAFMRYITGTGYVTYNYLSRLETGVASNNVAVTIPGYFATQPRVIVSPANLKLYDAAYAAQSQSIQCEARDLVETSPGSMRWSFTPVATLSLAANSGQTVINQSSGTISTNWTSSQYVTPANTASITPNVTLNSVLGDGASLYYRRTVRWRVEYLSAGSWVVGAWTTANIGDSTTSPVTSSATFLFPSAAAWTFRIYAEAYNTDGTKFGSVVYDYAQGTATNTGTTTVSFFKPGTYTANMTLSGWSPPSGYSVYKADYSVNWSGGWASGIYYSMYVAGTWVYTNNQTDYGKNGTRTWSTSSYSNTIELKVIETNGDATGMGYSCQASISNGSATFYARKPRANSTTAQNSFKLNYYNYNLTAAQVLATGSLHWMAIGQ